MVVMTTMVLDVLQESNVVHDDRNVFSGLGSAKMFRVIKC
jgi:hypothetical protein